MLSHSLVEKSAPLFVLLTFITIAIGGLVQIVPLFKIESTIEPVRGVRPYSPLELLGRNIYMREGCYNCHSQMVRPFRDEIDRYGHYSLAAESMYDYPFLWGSKRTGPDLARVGGKYSNEWHTAHLVNPRDVLPNSIMPAYAFLLGRPLDTRNLRANLEVLRRLDVPYTSAMMASVERDLKSQATPTDDETPSFRARYPNAPLGPFTGQTERITEMDALIAYLQVLGTMVDFSSFDARNMRQGR
jgi:cytochrome c oxidase cbb3-type subunit 2